MNPVASFILAGLSLLLVLYIIKRFLSLSIEIMLSFVWTFLVAFIAISICIDGDGRNACHQITHGVADAIINQTSSLFNHTQARELVINIINATTTLLNKLE